MRLPRWLTFSLLAMSGFAILTAMIWWWSTWPQRAVGEFAALVRAGDIDAAALFMPNVQEIVETPGVIPSQFEQSRLAFARREVAEIIFGRASFRVRDVPYQFQVERGSITGSPDGWSVVPITSAARAGANTAAGWTAPTASKEWPK